MLHITSRKTSSNYFTDIFTLPICFQRYFFLFKSSREKASGSALQHITSSKTYSNYFIDIFKPSFFSEISFLQHITSRKDSSNYFPYPFAFRDIFLFKSSRGKPSGSALQHVKSRAWNRSSVVSILSS